MAVASLLPALSISPLARSFSAAVALSLVFLAPQRPPNPTAALHTVSRLPTLAPAPAPALALALALGTCFSHPSFVNIALSLPNPFSPSTNRRSSSSTIPRSKKTATPPTRPPPSDCLFPVNLSVLCCPASGEFTLFYFLSVLSSRPFLFCPSLLSSLFYPCLPFPPNGGPLKDAP